MEASMAHSSSRFVGAALGGALLVAVPLAAAAQDRVPVLNVDPTCRGTETTAAGFGRGEDVCRRTELTARDELTKHWSEFPVADRSRCVRLATMTDLTSYVQILTCLEMAREARDLAQRDRSTVGTGR
jgi:hypothetical protein